jgi:hypothetical protein
LGSMGLPQTAQTAGLDLRKNIPASALGLGLGYFPVKK